MSDTIPGMPPVEQCPCHVCATPCTDWNALEATDGMPSHTKWLSMCAEHWAAVTGAGVPVENAVAEDVPELAARANALRAEYLGAKRREVACTVCSRMNDRGAICYWCGHDAGTTYGTV